MGKLVLYTFLATALILFSNKLFAQAPIISYPLSSYTFTVGTAISTLSPSNSGGAIAPTNTSFSTFATLSGTSYSVATDASSNVYAVDYSASTIYKYNSAGVSTTLNTTSTSGPVGIAVDGLGNIYVSDFITNDVYQFNSSGTLTATITGFSAPYGIACDAANNVYVADNTAFTVVKIAAGTLTKSTFLSGFANAPLGITIVNNDIYVTENIGNNVVKIANAITGSTTQTTFATGFNAPHYLTSDAAGNLYVADYSNNVLKKITPGGVVSTLITGLTTPRDVAINSYGILYIANSTTNNVVVASNLYSITPALPAGLSFDPNTGFITGTPTATSATATYTITGFNPSGSSATTVAITINAALASISYSPTPVSLLVGTAVGTAPNPTITLTNTGGAVPAAAYGTVTTLVPTTAAISNPRGITSDGAGNLYEADFTGNAIYLINSAGTATLIAGSTVGETDNTTGTSAKFNGPTGIVYDGSGFLYVTDNAGSTIRKVSTTSPYAVTTIAGLSGSALETTNTTGALARFNKPYGITYDGSGFLYVTDNVGSTIRKISTTSPFTVTTIAGISGAALELDNTTGTSAKFNGPAGIVYDGSGFLYVTDEAGSTIRKVGTTGLFPVTTFAGTAGTAGSANGTGLAATFKTPWGIAIDAAGNLIIADEGNALIRIITPGAVVTTLAGSGVTGEGNAVGVLATFTLPYSVATDNLGNVFAGDNNTANSTIRKILLTGYTISPAQPAGLTFSTTTGAIAGTASASTAAADYTVTAYNATGGSSTIINITCYKNFVWKGTSSTTWATVGNWVGGVAPTSADQAEIGATGQAITNLPIIPAGSTINIGSILLGTLGNKAATITVNGTGVLNVSGDITYQSDASSLINTAYATALAGTGTINASNLNIIASTNLNSYTETLTSSVTNLNLSGDLNLTSTWNSATKIENAKLNFTSGTMTVDGINTSNANAANTSTFSIGNNTTLQLTGAAALSGLSGTGTNTLAFNGTGVTVGYNGTNDQIVYTDVVAGLASGVTYTNINFPNTSTGIKTASSGNLTITGSFTNSLANDVGDYIDLSSPTVKFTGGTVQALAGGAGTGTKFYNVVFSGAGAKTMSGIFSVASSGTLNISGAVTTLNAGAGVLTLNSDATGSANVGAITSPSVINGTVNVQRYVQGNNSTSYRGYRAMTSPVSTTGLIDLNYLPTNTIVTGATCTGCTAAGNPSLFLYNETLPTINTSFVSGNFVGVTKITTGSTTLSTLSGVTTTTTSTLPAGSGFFLFFRGDKTTNLVNKTLAPYAGADNVTFTATGTLNQGTIQVKDWYSGSTALSRSATASVAQGFHLVGNPYASSIDWDTYTAGTAITHTNISSTIYIYNTVLKTYATYAAGNSGAMGVNFPSATTNANIIPSGQGFFVQVPAAGAAALSFTENAKINSQQASTTNLLLSAAPVTLTAPQYFRLQLFKDSINWEETLVAFNSTASNAFVENEDSPYLKGGSAVSFSSMSADNIALAINRIPFPKQRQIINLNVTAASAGTYHLNMTKLNNIPNLIDIWLMDAYNKDSVDIKHNPTYSFSITGDAASSDPKRFTLVIRQNTANAYHLLSFNGSKAAGGSQLTWTTENEENYTTFTVERSTNNGNTFTALDVEPANCSGSYSYLDQNPVAGLDQYRLKQVDVNGTVTYSNLVQLQYSNSRNKEFTDHNINIFPNPVRGAINLNIVTKDNAPTAYEIKITNSNGYVVKTFTSQQKTWQNNIGDLKPGVYIIKVINKTDNSEVGTNKFIKL